MADLTVTAAQVAACFPKQAEIYTFKAAETITAGQAVYLTSSGTVGLCDTNAAGKQQFRGIALNGGGAGQAIDVLKEGHCYGFDLSGMDYDAIAYGSDTAGALGDGVGTLTVNAGRVAALPDASLTKVLYVRADWLRAWA